MDVYLDILSSLCECGYNYVKQNRNIYHFCCERRASFSCRPNVIM